jgi:hypothetical protein
MYVISEHVACTALIGLVAALLFAASAAFVMILEASPVLNHVVCRSFDGTAQRGATQRLWR